MYVELKAAYDSLRIASDLALAAVSAHQRAKLQEALTDLNERLHKTGAAALASQEEVTTLRGKVHDLETENRRLRDWSAEAEHYALKQVGPGVFAYVHKGDVQPPQSAVKLCATCYDQKQRSVLQTAPEHPPHGGFMRSLTCNRCKAKSIFVHFLAV